MGKETGTLGKGKRKRTISKRKKGRGRVEEAFLVAHIDSILFFSVLMFL